MPCPPIRRLVLVTCLALLPTLAAAQAPPETRAEWLRQQRAEKARSVAPYQPNALEKAITLAEDKAVFLIGREGLYPKLGSLATGSGFAIGPGFRTRGLFNHAGMLDVWAAASRTRYWAVEARATFPDLARGRLFAEAYASHRDYPLEDFFGIGPDARRADQVNYALRTTTFGGRAGVRPGRFLRLGAGLDLIRPDLGPQTDHHAPSIETIFTETTAPGLDRQPEMLATSGFVEVDYRQPRNARRGGWYRMDVTRFVDREFDRYSFTRVDVDLRQYVSFFAERRVLAGRAFVSSSGAGKGQVVPFYLMPHLGGNDTLRGFREYRFRGPHALLLQGEYRFEIWSGFDGALFYDAGKVATRRGDLDLRGLERDYGFGFRFNTNEGVVMRVDAGFGSRDGKHLYITFGGVF